MAPTKLQESVFQLPLSGRQKNANTFIYQKSKLSNKTMLVVAPLHCIGDNKKSPKKQLLMPMKETPMNKWIEGTPLFSYLLLLITDPIHLI